MLCASAFRRARLGYRLPQRVIADLALEHLVADDPCRGGVQLELGCDGEIAVELALEQRLVRGRIGAAVGDDARLCRRRRDSGGFERRRLKHRMVESVIFALPDRKSTRLNSSP